MFVAGFVVFCGFAWLMFKLPIRMKLWLLGHTLFVDVLVSVAAYALHWGTFTGVMAAAVAGLLCSAFTSSARWAFGCIKGRVYYPGKIWRYK